MGDFYNVLKKPLKQSLPMKIFIISHILEKANVGPTQEYKKKLNFVSQEYKQK